MREKWDHRRGETTYGAQTIERALAGRTEFYSEQPSSNGREDTHDEQARPDDAPKFIDFLTRDLAWPPPCWEELLVLTAS